jgi:hypothetical protein
MIGKCGQFTDTPTIEIHRDKRKGVLGLSQEAYLEKVAKKYSMHASKPTPVPIVKGNGFGTFMFQE